MIEAACTHCGRDGAHRVLDDDGTSVLARCWCCGKVIELQLTPASTSSILKESKTPNTPSEGTT